MYEPNLCNYDENNAFLMSLDHDSRNKNLKSMQVSQDGKNWLKKHMDIDFENVYDNMPRTAASQNRPKTSARGLSATTPNRNRRIVQKSERVKSAVRAASEVRSLSRYSEVSTVISRVPDLAPFQLMNLAMDIKNLSKLILEKIQEGATSVSVRDQLSCSQIQKIVALCGYKIDISHLKALLKELGFNWNGKSCSIHQLLMKLKDYTNPQPLSPKAKKAAEIADDVIGSPQKKENVDQIVKVIKDVFYSTGKSLFQLYRQCCSLGRLESEGFQTLLQGLGLEEHDIETVFRKYADSDDKKSLSYQTFEKVFKLEVPNPGSHAMEVSVIKKVREWMFNKQYPSNGAFERLIRSVDRFSEKTLTRTDFHKAMVA